MSNEWRLVKSPCRCASDSKCRPVAQSRPRKPRQAASSTTVSTVRVTLDALVGLAHLVQRQQVLACQSVNCGVGAHLQRSAARSEVLSRVEQKLDEEEPICYAAHLQRRTAHQQRSTAAAGLSKGTKECLSKHFRAGLAATSGQWGRQQLVTEQSNGNTDILTPHAAGRQFDRRCLSCR